MSSTLQPRRSPEPGRPFINREKELQLVHDKLQEGLQGKQMPSVVICFWGAFGMGKSWLLIELERRHTFSGSEHSGSHPSITARLDLNKKIIPRLWVDDRLNRESLVRELWKQFASQLGTEVPDLGRASAEEWAEKFVKRITEWAAQSVTPLFMLDTVDDLLKMDEPTFIWLEQHVIEPLALTDRVLFVFTSRGEPSGWKRFQVRRRIDSQRLCAFDPETAGKEVDAAPVISRLLYRHAFGHPLFTECLGTALENQGYNLKGTAQSELSIEPPFLKEILRQVVDEILTIVPVTLHQIAKNASVLRWVSVEPLRSLAEALGLVDVGRGDAFYLDNIIAELQAHHLLYWNNDQNCYEPDPVLRKLMAYELELDDPVQFGKAHKAAYAFHQKHLVDSPQYLSRYVPELAFHHKILSLCPEAENNLISLETWWQDFLAKSTPVNPEPWVELVKTLQQDHELEEILPPQDYRRLLSEAQKRALSPS
jgi:hypothetical protein